MLEAAIAGAADAVITRNSRDFAGAELRFPNLRIVHPEHLMQRLHIGDVAGLVKFAIQHGLTSLD